MANDPERPVSNPDTSNPAPSGVSRRTLVRVLTAGGVGVTAASLPSAWTKPLVDAVVVPLSSFDPAVIPEPDFYHLMAYLLDQKGKDPPPKK